MNKMMKRKWTTGKWGKRLFTAILSAAIVLTAATPALAVQHIDPKKSDCSITLDLKYKDAANAEQQMKDGEEIQIYQVATVKIDNGYHFELTEAFAGMDSAKGIPDMDGSALGNPDLAKKIAADLDTAKAAAKTTANAASGSAKFSGLNPGLYLIRHNAKSRNDVTFNPFLISIPDEKESYDVVADPKLSFLLAMEPCVIDPPVIKKVLDSNGNEITDTTGTFVFRMEPTGANASTAPMPDGLGIAKDLTLKGSTTYAGTGIFGPYYKDSVGTLSEFGEITYDQEGVWTYKISEVSVSDGYEVNEEIYTVTVTVTGDFEARKYKADITVVDKDNREIKDAAFTFTNKQTPSETNPPTGGGGNGPGGGGRRSRPETSNPPTTPGEVLGATRDAAEDTGRGVLGAVRNPQVLGAVRTGDTSAMVTWAVILMLAASGIVGWFNVYHRKKSIRSL